MVQINKKIMSIIGGSCATIVIGGVVAANYLLSQRKNNEILPESSNVLNRDKNYHHYNISDKFKANIDSSKIVKVVYDGNNIFYKFDEESFKANIKSIMQETLKNIATFSNNYLSYKYICNYKIIDNNAIQIDIVWYLEQSIAKYYDQFVIELITY